MWQKKSPSHHSIHSHKGTDTVKIEDIINARINTATQKILSDFDFGVVDYAGAVKAGDLTWNTATGAITGGSGVALYRKGIVGAKNGIATFSIDATTGDAVFAGDLAAATGTFASLYTNSAEALTIDYGGDILLKEGGDIKFTSVTAPTACTATLIATATGNVDNGTHIYKVTYVNAAGETELGTASNTVTVDAANKQVALSVIPTSSSASVTSRKIYRTKAGGSTYYYLLTTLTDNTTTTYTDNTADANLGVEAHNRENTTFGKILIENVNVMSLGNWNSFVGRNAGAANVGGYYNTFVGQSAGTGNINGYCNTFVGTSAGASNTYGEYNTFLGYYAGNENTQGYENTFIGVTAGNKNTTGYDNTALGKASGYTNITGIQNTYLGAYAGSFNTGNASVFLGYAAGYYETGPNKLFIDNQPRASEADARIKALIYGIFAAATTDQKLTINGLFNQSVSKTPASAIATGTAGDICWDVGYIYVCTATDTWKRVAIVTW